MLTNIFGSAFPIEIDLSVDLIASSVCPLKCKHSARLVIAFECLGLTLKS